MATISIRELARNVSGVIRDVEDSHRPAVVTRNGAPVAAVVPLDPEGLEDYVLANAPTFVSAMEAADRDLALGRTSSIEEAFRDLEALGDLESAE
ncbi:MAG TPA: type II toxin-antitoxin system Phd/YefM family antitoxin [Actinomycetota bacterium]|nr:type II toxin-antitoxin system Phd/YefM family antitoxin [Actinomycetota bacterium]